MNILSRFVESNSFRVNFNQWEGNFINNSDVGYPEQEDDMDELPPVNYPKTENISEVVED
jgi:hypothetical protein